jgi:heme-degrading monooxygenase HmoA
VVTPQFYKGGEKVGTRTSSFAKVISALFHSAVSSISFHTEYFVITLINCFEVPAGREEEFFSAFQQVDTYRRAKKGYVSHKMRRSLAPDARYRFVNVVQWASREECEAAHDTGFRELVMQPAWAEFRSTPGLYEVVHEARA